MDEDLGSSPAKRLKLTTDKVISLLDWSGKKDGSSKIDQLWKSMADLAWLTGFSVRLDGNDWDDFFRILRLVPDHQMKSERLFEALKNYVDVRPPEDILEKLTSAMIGDAKAQHETPEGALRDTLNLIKRGGLNGAYFDDMQPWLGGAVGRAHVAVIDWCAETNGKPRAISWIKQLFNESYIEGREVRDPDSLYNQALLASFECYVSQSLHSLDPQGALRTLFHIYADLTDRKYRLAEALFEKENALLPAVSTFLDQKISQDPQEAMEILHDLAEQDTITHPQGRGKSSFQQPALPFTKMLGRKIRPLAQAFAAESGPQAAQKICEAFLPTEEHDGYRYPLAVYADLTLRRFAPENL